MDVRMEVKKVWNGLRPRERRILRSYSKGSPDARFRVRCLIVVNLMQQSSPSEIARVLNCARSHVYRVAERFIGEGMSGLEDRREDNGEVKVDEEFEANLFLVLEGSPHNFRYERSTWTLELLTLVLSDETGVGISTTTMSRVLARFNIRLRSPKPLVTCWWKKARRTRRLNQLQRLIDELPEDEVVVYADEVDIHLNPKVGRDWTLPGRRRTVIDDAGEKRKALSCRCV